MRAKGQASTDPQAWTCQETTRQPESPSRAIRSIRAGMRAGIRAPAMVARTAVVGMGTEHTVIGSKAGLVPAGVGRTDIATFLVRPSASVTRRSGHDAPAGITALATSPEAASVVGAASAYAEITCGAGAVAAAAAGARAMVEASARPRAVGRRVMPSCWHHAAGVS